MKIAAIVCLIFLGFVENATAKPTTSCFGPKNSVTGLVYLHGIDPVEPSSQEEENRRILKKLAAKLNFSLAIVRSNERCSDKKYGDKLCWPRGDNQQIQALLAEITDVAGSCFSKAAKVGVLGFSNGGYLLNAAVTQCLPSSVNWLISIGAAGDVPRDAPKTSANCADQQLHLMIGTKDLSSAKVQRTLNQLKSLGRNVALTEFKGGHEIPEKPVAELITKLTGTPAITHVEISGHCDLPGNDLSNQAADNPEKCSDICQTNSKCAAFVFVSGWGRCQLKNKAGRRVKITMHSGIKQADGSITLAPDTDSSGKDKERISGIKSASACAELCSKDKSCKAASYLEGYADCWLKSTTGRQKEKIFSCGSK